MKENVRWLSQSITTKSGVTRFNHMQLEWQLQPIWPVSCSKQVRWFVGGGGTSATRWQQFLAKPLAICISTSALQLQNVFNSWWERVFQSNVFQPTHLPILTCQVSKFQGTNFRNLISGYACALGRSVNVSDWACIELNRSLAPLPGFGRVTFGEAKNIWIKVVLNDNQVNLDYLKITDLTGNILWEERL